MLTQGTWERLLGAQWHAVRADCTVLTALALVVVVVPVLLTAGWAGRTAGTATARRPRGATGTVSRLVRATAIGTGLAALAVAATAQWTYLLLVAVFAAPALVVPLTRLSRRRSGSEPVGRSVAALLRRRYTAAAPATVLGAAMLVAAVFAFPATAILMIGGIEGEPATMAASLVSRPSSAVYVGHAPLTAADAQQAADVVGAQLTSWQSLSITQPAPDGDEVMTSPAISALARSVCLGPTADARCERVLRGVGVADRDAVESLLGRNLSDAERAAYAKGTALVLDKGTISGDGTVTLIPAGDLFIPSCLAVPLPALSTPVGRGTVPTSSLPAVFLAPEAVSAAATGTTLIAADTSYLFELDGPATAAQERSLRRAIVARVEVSGDDEFLLTRMDAARVSMLRQVLDRFPVVALLLAAGVAVLSAAMLSRDAARDRRVLLALGASRRTVATWFATTLAATATAGAVAALGASGVADWVLVRMEVHHGLPASGWVSVWFLLPIPLVTGTVAAAWGWWWAPRAGAKVTALDTG